MSFYFHQARYLFGFITDNQNIEVLSHKFFYNLMKPDVVQNIVGDIPVFKQFFVEPKYHFTHKEDKNTSSFNNIVEYIEEIDEDIETTENECAFLIGFITDEKLSDEILEDIYNNLFIPVFQTISDNVKPTNRIIRDEDYIQNRRTVNVGNSYVEKIDRKEMNQERLLEVVAEGAESTFVSYHPEHKETIATLLKSKKNVLKNISEGLEIAEHVNDKKELASKLQKLRVLNFVMFALKHNISDPENTFKSLGIKTRIRAIENFMEN